MADTGVRSSRIPLALLAALQLAGGLSSFGAWALLSHSSSSGEFARASTALAWGLSLYLPLTFGLPFIMANFERELGSGNPRTMWTLVVTEGTTAAATLAGVLLSACDVIAGDGDLTVPAVAACLAGVSTSSVTLQQQARIHLRVDWMVLSLYGPIALPLAWVIKVLSGIDARWSSVVVCVILAAGAALQVSVLRRSERSGSDWTTQRDVLGRILRVGLPLLPHMFAFGALLQGARLAATLRGGRPDVVATASSMMLFLGVGFAVIAGVHGLLATGIQRSRRRVLSDSLSRFASAYGLLGFAAALGTVAVVYSPVRSLLDEMPAPSVAAGAAMAAAPGALCSYYLLSTLLVRVERTALLALVTLSVSGTFFTVAVVRPWSASNLIVLYAIAVSSLHLCALPFALRYGGLHPRAVLTALSATWIGFIPAVVLALVGLLHHAPTTLWSLVNL